MKCPYCKKEINRHSIYEINEKEVLNEISKEIHSISSLSKKLKIKRSTLRYYINNLIKKRKIVEERFENLCGRPTILRIKNNPKNRG